MLDGIFPSPLVGTAAVADLTEEHLTDGTVTAGLVRVGDTVHRPRHERSDSCGDCFGS